MTTETFTPQELLGYDGKEGAAAYIAFDGQVYDVSQSFFWKGGRHQARHQAGRDCTEALLHDAPHGPDLLERVPAVGRLVAEKE